MLCAHIEPLESRTLLSAVKIMPLGDSITEGYNTNARVTYRFWLNKRLGLEGYDTDFVGTRNGVWSGTPAYTDWDSEHQGVSGWRADQVAAQVNGWATTAQPDIVLLHIGTNDVLQSQSTSNTVNEIGQIIDQLRAARPNVTVLLAQLIPAQFFVTQVSQLNAQLPGLVSAKDTPQSRVVLVDQFTGFDVSTDHWDGLHPNARGEIKMSDKWFDALVPFLPAPSPPPPITWLSSLNPVSASNGFGPVERDMSNGGSGARDGEAIHLNGVSTIKGLGVHANSEIVYNLNGQYARFRAEVGIDEEVSLAGSVIFRVFVDDVLQFHSGLVTGASATQSIDIDMAGASSLKLVVSDGGNNTDLDHADWANARLIVAPTVSSAGFAFATAPHELSFTFRGDVSQSLSTDDLLLENVTTSTTIPASSMNVVYDDQTDTATFTFPGFSGGVLSDGRYRATILSAGVSDDAGNPMLADHLFNFLFLLGDADNDGTVGLLDFNLLAMHFGASGRDFTHGDFDYNGTVNLADFNILAGSFGTSLPEPSRSPRAAFASTRIVDRFDADDPLEQLLR